MNTFKSTLKWVVQAILPCTNIANHREPKTGKNAKKEKKIAKQCHTIIALYMLSLLKKKKKGENHTL